MSDLPDYPNEPVATAEQSNVPGKRVGPPTFAQDPTSGLIVPGVTQIEPGQEVAASTPWDGGLASADAVPGDDEPQTQKSGPVKNDHPTATKAGEKKAGS